jgi:hypothetical protein
VSDRALSVAEVLHRAGGPAYGRVTAAQLEDFLTRGELGEVVDDQVVVSAKARALSTCCGPSTAATASDAPLGSVSGGLNALLSVD